MRFDKYGIAIRYRTGLDLIYEEHDNIMVRTMKIKRNILNLLK